MQSLFTDLLELLEKPLPSGGGVKTDNSILLVYPPERELDFREYLLDRFFLSCKPGRFLAIVWT